MAIEIEITAETTCDEMLDAILESTPDDMDPETGNAWIGNACEYAENQFPQEWKDFFADMLEALFNYGNCPFADAIVPERSEENTEIAIGILNDLVYWLNHTYDRYFLDPDDDGGDE